MCLFCFFSASSLPILCFSMLFLPRLLSLSKLTSFLMCRRRTHLSFLKHTDNFIIVSKSTETRFPSNNFGKSDSKPSFHSFAQSWYLLGNWCKVKEEWVCRPLPIILYYPTPLCLTEGEMIWNGGCKNVSPWFVAAVIAVVGCLLLRERCILVILFNNT